MADPQGEYWIFDHGSVEYCDGDIGDSTHESIALDHAQKEVIEKLGGSTDQFDTGVDWKGWKRQKIMEILQAKYGQDWQAHRNEGNSLLVDAAHQSGVTDELWEVADGHGDARDYAVENWGWKAVRGTSVDTWTFTRSDAAILADALGEVLDQEGDDYDDDEEAEEVTWDINVNSTNDRYDMTISELEAYATGRDAQQDKADDPEASTQSPGRITSSDFDQQNRAASNATRRMDLENMPDYYKNKPHPFADSFVGLPTFSEWVRSRQGRARGQ